MIQRLAGIAIAVAAMIGTTLVAVPANAVPTQAHVVTDKDSKPSPGDNGRHATESGGPTMTLTSEQLDDIYPGGSKLLDPVTFARGLKELEASAVPRTEVHEGSETFYRYVTPQGSVTLPSAADYMASVDAANQTTSDQNRLQISVRSKSGKWAMGFNSVDQAALASGAAAAATFGICLIPAVGNLACGILSVGVSVAMAYVVAHGVCSKGQMLWWYDVKGGSVVHCRSTAPF
ncbi:hypothetical protein LK09_10545 [Microbacterium mangrovi]|uniref:Secreted protein n=2 Tax=Microbacterium mangrovi TaxID=1348253 RepID=A0A0B2A7B7_9MICO|nr:hypothetical protein LK09_10545 [Microbacterium mangrovi]